MMDGSWTATRAGSVPVGKSFQEGTASSARPETAEKEKRRLRSSNIVFMDTGLSKIDLEEYLIFAHGIDTIVAYPAQDEKKGESFNYKFNAESLLFP